MTAPLRAAAQRPGRTRQGRPRGGLHHPIPGTSDEASREGIHKRVRGEYPHNLHPLSNLDVDHNNGAMEAKPDAAVVFTDRRPETVTAEDGEL